MIWTPVIPRVITKPAISTQTHQLPPNPNHSSTCKMELCSFQASPFIPTNNFSLLTSQKSSLFPHFHPFFDSNTHPPRRNLKISHIAPQLSPGVARFRSSAIKAVQESVDVKDENTVFVAGATGRVGSRTVRELLKMGFQVRAGVRSSQRAQSLVQSVRDVKVDAEDKNGVKPIEKLEIVECDLEKRGQIVPALGSASLVICCIGASEKEIFDVTGPYRIDYLATKNLIDAASDAKVKHFILLTSLGTNKIGFPAAILNLFWGVLLWKRKAEEALISSGLPYTIVRPGGMERPTDSFKETHNLTLSQEDTLFGGLVSNLQVAELMAFMAQNRKLSYCKIVEVVAETTAPLTPMEKLLKKIPSNREDIYKVEEKEIATSDIESATPVIPTNEPEPETDTFETAAVELQKIRPLSPYAVYEDLKPPSSPCPSPPGKVHNEPVKALEDVDGVPQAMNGNLPENDPRETTFYHSPFPVYEDLKPPTSPTPTAPNSFPKTLTLVESQAPTASISTEEEVKALETQNTVDELKPIEPKPRPLSPYTMYEDMKPPTSPMPSPKAH